MVEPAAVRKHAPRLALNSGQSKNGGTLSASAALSRRKDSINDCELTVGADDYPQQPFDDDVVMTEKRGITLCAFLLQGST